MEKVPAVFSGRMFSVLGIGIGLGALAGTVMVGRFARPVLLMKIFPTFAPMQRSSSIRNPVDVERAINTGRKSPWEQTRNTV
ncbi:MAG: hypothetical protein WD407_06010 [Rhodospirillales bacterium]